MSNIMFLAWKISHTFFYEGTNAQIVWSLPGQSIAFSDKTDGKKKEKYISLFYFKQRKSEKAFLPLWKSNKSIGVYGNVNKNSAYFFHVWKQWKNVLQKFRSRGCFVFANIKMLSSPRYVSTLCIDLPALPRKYFKFHFTFKQLSVHTYIRTSHS